MRKYDLLAGRFTSPDPLWEKYVSLTPYQYAGNNPVVAVDLTGKDIEIAYRAPGTYYKLDPGHIALAVTQRNQNGGTEIKASWSFTPKSNSILTGIEVGLGVSVESRQADIKIDLKDATEKVTIKTNQQFDKTLSALINARIEESKNNNEGYGVYKTNCATTLNELLNATFQILNMDIKLDDTILPDKLLNVVKSQKTEIENESKPVQTGGQ